MLLALCYWCLLIGLFFYRNPIKDSSDWLTASYRAAWLSISQGPADNPTLRQAIIRYRPRHRLNIERGRSGTAPHDHSAHVLNLSQRTADKYHPPPRSSNLVHTSRFVTTIRPIQHYEFELFFANHVISVIALFIAVLKHAPSYAHVYIWIALGYCRCYIAMVSHPCQQYINAWTELPSHCQCHTGRENS
ncbi:hypothetical protein V1520DRAFT_11395 [Lipomyces starkeyi]